MKMFVSSALCLALVSLSFVAGDDLPTLVNDGDDGNTALKEVEGAKGVAVHWRQHHLDTEPQYTLAEIYHVAASGTKSLIGRVTEAEDAHDMVEGYQLVANINERNERLIALTIDQVGQHDEGRFRCVLVSKDDEQDTVTVDRELILLRKLQKLSLQFADRDPISAKPDSPIEEKAGTYVVKCAAEGSNPATDEVKVHLDGNEVALVGTAVTAKMEGNETRYLTTVTANVTLPAEKKVQVVECAATDPLGDKFATQLEVSVQVDDEGEEDQVVECVEETEAEEGDMDVVLACTVMHTKINVTKYAFQVGKTGDVIEAGAGDKNQTERVAVEKLSADKTKVTITIAKVKAAHFGEDFYMLLTLADGSVRKETLRLKDGGNTGSRVTPAMAGYALTALVLAALWK